PYLLVPRLRQVDVAEEPAVHVLPQERLAAVALIAGSKHGHQARHQAVPLLDLANLLFDLLLRPFLPEEGVLVPNPHAHDAGAADAAPDRTKLHPALGGGRAYQLF